MEVASIYNQFHHSLLTFIRSKIKSREDAEDILQNVFIKISGSIDKLQDAEKLKSWIYTISRNAIIDYYRANSNNKRSALDDSLEESVPETDSVDATKGLEQCLSGMINLLPGDYRNIIIDAELNGIKQKDLAVKYDMPYPSMRSRVQRGRERLKQLLYNCCHIETDRLGNVLEAQSRSGCADSCSSCSDNS
jgi:RNA polymerase sigma-70 factor, ECF subfamily